MTVTSSIVIAGIKLQIAQGYTLTILYPRSPAQSRAEPGRPSTTILLSEEIQ